MLFSVLDGTGVVRTWEVGGGGGPIEYPTLR
jgi:hypothetical protein